MGRSLTTNRRRANRIIPYRSLGGQGMVLRILVAVMMTIFCLWQGFVSASVPSAGGHHYFPVLYVLVPFLLWGGLNPLGLFTWPLATVLLLARGHWVAGWIPLALVAFNVIGNRLLLRDRRSNAGC